MKAFLPVVALLSCLAPRAFAQGGSVSVVCIDSATKRVFDIADTPAGKLPDKFTVNTVLEIKGVKWMVLAADPAAKGDFLKAGKVTLLLAKADKMYPGGVRSALFAIPTVSGGIGHLAGNTPPGPDIFPIKEDDWRQVEFVSLGYEKEIAAEFAGIHKIRAAGTKAGFADMHVRELITDPVRDLTLKDVRDLLPAVKTFQAVGFSGERGALPHSFAWTVDGGLVLWGLTDDEGDVTQLCLAGAPRKEHIAAISAALSKLTLRYDLYLVDWCKEARVSGGVLDFEKYFGGQ